MLVYIHENVTNFMLKKSELANFLQRYAICSFDSFTRTSTNADKPHDALEGQSRTPNMVPFLMFCMVSYFCAIVTLSERLTVFEIFDFKCRDFQNRVRVREGD